MGLMSGLAAFLQMVSEKNNIDIWNKIVTNDHDTTKDKTLGGKDNRNYSFYKRCALKRDPSLY